MKIFLLICLASGLASSEKLDRSYLPPPGSKFSGGSPGDIQAPFEFPKETYSTGRPQLADGKPDIELGINRRPALPTGALDNQTQGFTNYQNSYIIPTTTTSYAITQTTTFAPAEDYDGLDQPAGFINGSTRIQPGFQGQIYQQQPIRGPGQGLSYNQDQPGQSQTSMVTPYGTTSRPLFPGTKKGLEYLPPAPSSGNRGQFPGQVVSSQGDFSYPSGKPQRPKYQDGQLPTPGYTVNQPGYVYPGANQQNQYIGNQNIPSSTAAPAPQYQDGSFGPMGPGSQQAQSQFPGSQFSSSTGAPQYQSGQRFTVPGSNQKNQYLNQYFPSSTTAPQFQTGQRFTTPGLSQQELGSRLPNQQNQYTGNQENQIFPSSTSAPTPGLVQQSQFSEGQNFPSTAAPSYQNGQRFTTPGQIQEGFVPGQQKFGSLIPSQQGQNQYTGNQNYPPTTLASQFQDDERFSTPGYVQEGYIYPVPTQQNQNQYTEDQNFPPSTTAPQYQNSQQFTTPGPIQQDQFPGNQNFPSTGAPLYQDGQRFTTPGQYQGDLVSDQQRFGSRIPIQQSQSQYNENQNFPSSTAAPQYQESQRFTTPGQQQRFDSSQSNQQNLYPGSQSVPSSTAAPQYQDQRFSTPGQQVPVPNQPNYPGSTAAPQYQQTFASTPGINQQGFIPSQQNQYQQPGYNQQIPSSTGAPSKFIPGSQSYSDDAIQTTPGTAVSFPVSQSGFTDGQFVPTYGNTLQPTTQTGVGSTVYGTTPSVPSRFPTSTIGSLPARDFSLTPGNVVETRPERPQAEGDRNAEILNYENVLTPEGYYYSYDTSNGIHADETGTVGNGTRAQGGFSYIGDDGIVYSVFYSADENGFQPRGDHLPTPPPIPEAIQRVIDQANKDKESGIDDDGSYNEEKYGYMKYEGALTRLRPRNKTVPTVYGADIPDRTKSRAGGPKKTEYETKGTKLNTERYPETNNDSQFESEPESNKTDLTEKIHRDDDNLDKNKKTKTRISAKRPKPIKNLTSEDSLADKFKGSKIPVKSTINSKIDSSQNQKSIDRNGFIQRPISSENDEELATEYVSDTDISEEPEDNDDLRASQGIDYDSDLINYKDDPNNRTDFHGLNKYLPKPKETNKKSKKRPTAQINGTRRPVAGATKTERPGDRNGQVPEEIKSDVIDEVYTRIPLKKNKFGQKMKDQSKTTAQVTFDSHNETDTDDSADTNEEYETNKTRPAANDRMYTPGTEPNKKISEKPRRPTVNDRIIVSGNQEQLSADRETGYEYTPPQRKFESGGAIKFPSRTFPQKGTQTTLRPFITKNVYGDDNEATDEDIDKYGVVKPGRPERPGRPARPERPARPGRPGRPGHPIFTQKQQYPGFQQEDEVNEDGSFTSTRKPVGSYEATFTRRPSGRPQTTALPQYEGESVNDEDRYNGPISTQGSQRPEEELYYNTNGPNRETSKTGNVFSSTTPLAPSTPDSFKYRPQQYQDKPTGGSAYYDETTLPRGEISRPGYNRPVSAQVPSTTYRPNYSFGDRTSAPSAPINVDGFGRPITSTIAPTFEGTTRPTYSTVRPSTDEDLGNLPSQIGDNFRPTEGRFGVTSSPQGPGYQSSTLAPIGEDFSGPKQPQRFDPDSGYYYK